MQVNGQNIQQKAGPQTQYNSNVVTQPIASQTQCCNAAPQSEYPQGYLPPQNTIYPQYQPAAQIPQGQIYPTVQQQTQPAQPQNVQIPATASGVNIQIFNPSVSTPGAQPPTYNVNAPCYPSSYYTSSVGSDGKLQPNNGSNNPHTGDNVNNGTNSGTIGDNNHNSYTTNNNTTTNNNGTESTENKKETNNDKKTEKRKIVELTDEYIKNLENYLNSQDKDIRRNAAKEVYERLKEDDSRHDDKALTALINKMLQDPSEDIRVIALSALDERIVTGDDYTVNVLKNIQQTNNGTGQDAVDASNILLKMSSRQVEKEFEVKDQPKKDKNDEKKDNKKA